MWMKFGILVQNDMPTAVCGRNRTRK